MLVNYRECKCTVARRAKACPHCGARHPAKSKLEASLDSVASDSLKAGMSLTFGVPLLIIMGVALVAVIASVGGR